VSTNKRARQKANRANRIAAAQAAHARQTARRRMNRLGGGLLVLLIVGLGIFWFINRGGDESVVSTEPVETNTLPPVDATTVPPVDVSTTEPSPENTLPFGDEEPSDPNCPAPDHSSPRTIDFDGPQPMCINPALNYSAVFDTSEGEIVIDLDTENTPNTVNNFVTLARWGYYDNTTLFRTDPSIDIIQGGSPHTNSASDPGPGYTIPDEPTFTTDDTIGLVGPYRYAPGQLVMARSAGPDSSRAQFFFTTGDKTSFLDNQGTYIVFGNTNEAGLAVMQNIIGLHEPDDSGLGGSPSRTVTVNSVRIRAEPAS